MYKSVAIVFPGQGSQFMGMLSDIAAVYSSVQETFKRASRVLDYDLYKLVQDGPEKQLNITQYTQPALLTASVALWDLWYKDNPSVPRVVAGHSVGEYAALVAAQVLDFEDAVAAVSYRGQFMQEAVAPGEGAVAAVLGLSNQDIQAICVSASGEEFVTGVNFNSPGQVVIAGHTSAVERALVLAKEEGAKRTVLLPISVPVHCKLMQSAADKLKLELDKIEFKQPQIPLMQNVSCEIENNPAQIKAQLVRQVVEPVNWVKMVKYIAGMGVDLVIECGPGKVLSSLNKRIEPSLENVSIGTLSQLKDFTATI